MFPWSRSRPAKPLASADGIEAMGKQLSRLEDRLAGILARLDVVETGAAYQAAGVVGDPPVIQVSSAGNIANRMIQFMVAAAIADKVPGCRLAGIDLPEWGIVYDNIPEDGRHSLDVDGQWVPVARLATMLRHGLAGRVRFSAWGQSIENFLPREHYQSIFQANPILGQAFGDDVLVINLRGGEILHAPHPAYVLLPIEFYVDIVAQTGLRPVFMGQLTPSTYLDRLRKLMPEATYIESQGVIEDFQTLRKSKNIVLSVSTFSWLAAWLSEANQIIMPLAGLFNPAQCPDVNLITQRDSRYRFFSFPVTFASSMDKLSTAHGVLKGRWREISEADINLIKGKTLQQPRILEEYELIFDDKFYTNRYPDVANHTAAGYFPSPLDHFRRSGFSERREPLELDEVYYSINHPDAAEAISAGLFSDFYHFHARVGRLRGYYPVAPHREKLP